MSSIQIVPDDVGLSAAQELSLALGNFSLSNRLNTSDLEHAVITGAQEIGGGIQQLAQVLGKIQPALSFVLYATGAVLIIWCLLNILEKCGIISVRNKEGNSRRITPYFSRFRQWLTGGTRTATSENNRSGEQNFDIIGYKTDRSAHIIQLNGDETIPPPPEDSRPLVFNKR